MVTTNNSAKAKISALKRRAEVERWHVDPAGFEMRLLELEIQADYNAEIAQLRAHLGEAVATIVDLKRLIEYLVEENLIEKKKRIGWW